jgi:Asp-tRNA(Asn)/Glu-tRNA(Gln) amidotransferase A subunit family amidase
MDRELNRHSATELIALRASRKVTCEQIARDTLARVNARDAVVKAWAFVDPELILRRAQELDARTKHGALHGVPVGVKDVIETTDMPTQMGSRIYRGFRTVGDASCVALLRAAGALIFGKTVTCEFAGPAASATTNPHNVERTPGGSSSGSGAAVADYMVPFGFGTQTGGSVQRPSSFCGIVGYKPSFGLVNPQGVKPAAESLDTVGLMVRTIEDAALFMSVLTGGAPVEWLDGSESIRIAVCRTHVWEAADHDCRAAIEDAARRLEQAGLIISDVELPAPCEDLFETREIINDYERARAMAWEWDAHRDDISEPLSKAIQNGLTMPRERYIDALERVALCRRRVAALFNDVDVLLTPAAKGEAPIGLVNTGDHRFQSIWTQLHLPAVTLPTHGGSHGLPIGIQLVAPLYGDNRLLAMAQRIFSLLGHGPRIRQ